MSSWLRAAIDRRRWARLLVKKWLNFIPDCEVSIGLEVPDNQGHFTLGTWVTRVRVYVDPSAPKYLYALLNEKVYSQPTTRPDEYPTCENTTKRAKQWAEDQIVMAIQEREYVQPSLPL